MNLDLSFETPAAVKERDYSGPPLIVSGRGCRLTLKTLTEEEGRNEDILERLYGVVRLLHTHGLEGIAREPTEGHLRIHGGEPPFYVQGETQRDVITTLGRGILSGSAAVAQGAADLGVTALVEW